MIETFIIGMIIWLIGVYTAWFQIHYWDKYYGLSLEKEKDTIVMLCLLSWLVYPLYLVIWIFNGIKDN